VPGLLLNPGDSIDLQLIGDIEADVPYDHFVVALDNIQSLTMTDFNDTTHHPSILTLPTCGLSFPFASPVVQIFLPAGRPVLYHTQLPVRLAAPGQQAVGLFQSSLEYTSPTAVGELGLQSWRGKVMQRGPLSTTPVLSRNLFTAVRLRINDTEVAVDSALDADSIVLAISPEFVVSRGDQLAVEIVADIRNEAAAGNYVLEFSDSTFAILADRNLSTPSYPLLAAGGYPVLSAELAVSASGLAESFTNYPNPFNASAGGQTTIGFSLESDAYVRIEMFTVTGERVAVLLDEELRSVGSHQDIRWGAQNGSGHMVVPGVYFCQISVRFLSGNTETVRRKVAVVR